MFQVTADEGVEWTCRVDECEDEEWDDEQYEHERDDESVDEILVKYIWV